MILADLVSGRLILCSGYLCYYTILKTKTGSGILYFLKEMEGLFHCLWLSSNFLVWCNKDSVLKKFSDTLLADFLYFSMWTVASNFSDILIISFLKTRLKELRCAGDSAGSYYQLHLLCIRGWKFKHYVFISNSCRIEVSIFSPCALSLEWWQVKPTKFQPLNLRLKTKLLICHQG